MKTIRMKKEDWQKWDTALRSGEYSQAVLLLVTPDAYTTRGYCCLGVMQHCIAGEVVPMVDEDGTVQQVPDPGWLREHDIAFAAASGTPPDRWISTVPYLPTLGKSAAVANDSGEFDFIAIADAIKEAVEFTDV